MIPAGERGGRPRAYLSCAAALVVTAGQALAGPLDDSFSKDTSRLIETITSGATVRVVNPFGNIHARFGGYEDRVEIQATRQRLERKLPELRLVTSREGGGLTATVALGDEPAGGRASDGAHTRDRVDLVVFVPRGAALDARTRDGLIDVKKLEGDLIASSVRGDLRITSVRGRVLAKSVRGRITALLATGVTGQPQELSTETGDIEAYVGEDADLDVTLATSGETCTDFSIDIEHRRFEEPGKHGVARIGRGGARLRLFSKQGRVCLRRLQRDFRPGID